MSLLPSGSELLYTAELKAMLYDIHLSISCFPQGSSMKAFLELAKQLSSGNAASLAHLTEFENILEAVREMRSSLKQIEKR